MGLDMYLYRKFYVQNWDFMKPQDLTIITVMRNNKPLPNLHYDKITYIVEEVGYWRKANAIHQWFVDHCQNGVDDCKEYYVDVEQLRELVDICKEVISNPSKASTLLPTQSGFFFGGTDYNEYYIADLQSTVDQLTPLIEEGGDFYYHSSW